MARRFLESPGRSVIKAITFRILIIAADLVIILTITHRYDLAISIILLSNLSSTLLYIFHERLWNRIHWGKRVNH